MTRAARLREYRKAFLNVLSGSCAGLTFFAVCYGRDCDSLGFFDDEVDFLFVFAAIVFFRHLFKSSHIMTHCLELLVSSPVWCLGMSGG